MIQCPKCNAKSKVSTSVTRPKGIAVTRYRKCLRGACGHTFQTCETILPPKAPKLDFRYEFISRAQGENFGQRLVRNALDFSEASQAARERSSHGRTAHAYFYLSKKDPDDAFVGYYRYRDERLVAAYGFVPKKSKPTENSE
jgi:hypothetical protein